MFQNIFITNRSADEPATVYIWDDEKGLIVAPYTEFDYAYKLDRNGDKQTIYGDRVSRTTRWTEGASNIFESDVPRETRVLTDLYLDSDEVAKNHRLLVFDLEVERVAGAFASVEKADGRITAIGCYADVRDEYTVFLLDDKQRFFPRKQTVKNETIIAFDSESEMLEAFLSYYGDYAPTLLTGWNIYAYDVPYLYRRLMVLFDKETANMLSPIGMVKYSKRRGQYQIAGVSCLDYLEMYQKFTFSRRPSYRLHDIGLYEVEMGKIEYDGSLDDFYRDDLPGFIEYNLQDVRIVVEIDKKMKLVDLVKNISHVGHTQYEDYRYSSKYIEGTILTYLHRQGRVVPNKRAEGRAEFEEKLELDEEGFKGAYVKEPEPGLYSWVYNLDLQSLYPSIIMSLNISPETKIGYVKNWNLDQHLKKTATHYIVEIGSAENLLTRDQFIQFMKDEKFKVSSNGVLYRSDKLGVIPEILDVWFNQRLEFKSLQKKYKKEGNADLAGYYDRRQHVQKILLNSIYGVLGLPIFRFYDLDNALAVTATGQDVIKMTSKFINQKYIKHTGNTDQTEDWCIYIDTDSVYFSAQPFFDGTETTDEDRIKKTIEVAAEAEESVNKFYDVMSRVAFFCDSHRFVIKPEYVSRRAMWVAKKRYALWTVHDLDNNVPVESTEPSVKGLDIRRSSFPPAFKDLMNNCLTGILNDAPKEELDAIILKFRSDMNSMSFKTIARNTSVKNVSEFDVKGAVGYQKFPKKAAAHVKASVSYNRWLRAHKMDKSHGVIRDGDKIKWCYLKKNEFGIKTMALKGYDDPEELQELVYNNIDHQTLFDNELKNKLDDFYSAMGWGLVPTSVNQSAATFFSF